MNLSKKISNHERRIQSGSSKNVLFISKTVLNDKERKLVQVLGKNPSTEEAKIRERK
jgi:hypothetical protein